MKLLLLISLFSIAAFDGFSQRMMRAGVYTLATISVHRDTNIVGYDFRADSCCAVLLVKGKSAQVRYCGTWSLDKDLVELSFPDGTVRSGRFTKMKPYSQEALILDSSRGRQQRVYLKVSDRSTLSDH
jgi:hypothetical protein